MRRFKLIPNTFSKHMIKRDDILNNTKNIYITKIEMLFSLRFGSTPHSQPNAYSPKTEIQNASVLSQND